MMFVVVCVVLVALVLAAVSRPLLSGAGGLPARGQYDRAVYRDQLREVDRDVARGVLNADEADAARLEIQRRLLSVGEVGESVAAPRSPRLAIVTALCFVVAAGGLYWRLGAPLFPDAPFSERPPVEAEQPANDSTDQASDVKRAATNLEQKLAADPSNVGAWILYARATSMLGEWQKAADAYQHAIDLGQKGGDVLAGYGEMRVMAADGIVPPAAREAFTKALAADPGSGVARYYLALADAQAGEERKAVDAWIELASGLPEDSSMRREIARRVADASKSGGFEAPPMPKGLAAAPGPTPDQMDAAGNMPADQRAQMIAGMVEKLAAKLKEQPNDLEGWLRLARAYTVQGDGAKAVDAYDHAAALKPGDPEIKLHTAAALLTGLKRGDTVPPRAVTLLAEVATVAPDAPEVLWYQGVLAVHQGRFPEARDKWTQLAASLTPGGEDEKMVRAALDQLPAQ
jgi:cytochrome c-type biogenesis protein CcmH